MNWEIIAFISLVLIFIIAFFLIKRYADKYWPLDKHSIKWWMKKWEKDGKDDNRQTGKGQDHADSQHDPNRGS